MTVKGQILRSASVIAFVTAISRICGYLRDQRVALLLGTSPAADSFVLAFRIPSLIRRMTGEGSLGASFIPIFSGYLRDKPRAEAWAFAQKVFWDMAVVLAVVAALGAIFSRQVIYVFTLFGGETFHWDLAIYLNRIIFPAIFFIGLGGAGGGHPEQLSRLRASGIDADFFQSDLHRVFVWHSVSAGSAMGPRKPTGRRPSRWASGCWWEALFQLAMQIPALVRLGMPMGVSLSLSRSRRAQGRAVDGSELFRHGRVSDQSFRGHDFRHVVAHAFGQHHVALRGGPGHAIGAGKLRHRHVHRAAADNVASGGGRASMTK